MFTAPTDKALMNSLIVSTLGYFVDVYDLLLFSVVRTKSLLELKIPEEALLDTGLSLLNWMLVGMMLGGVVWGILGDKRGRRSVLFGSILIYSMANFLNAYVTDLESYKILRFVAGFGLAGELGAGITLVCELMRPDKRAYGTLLITAIGLLGLFLRLTLAKITIGDLHTVWVDGWVFPCCCLDSDPEKARYSNKVNIPTSAMVTFGNW